MAHIHEKVDFTSEVFIVYQNKVLLRLHDKYKFWLSVGGHIDLDEDPAQAAIREVKEEVGLDVTLYNSDKNMIHSEHFNEIICPQYMNRHRINGTHEHISAIYFARSNTDKLILCNNEKSEGCKWFTKEELDDSKYGIRPEVIKYAKSALEKLMD